MYDHFSQSRNGAVLSIDLKRDMEVGKFIFHVPQHFFFYSPPNFHSSCSPPVLLGIRKQPINSLSCESFLLLLPAGYQEGGKKPQILEFGMWERKVGVFGCEIFTELLELFLGK